MKTLNKIIGGITDGALGTSFVELMDKDGDGKVSVWEAFNPDFKSMDVGKLFRFLVSLATTIGSLVAIF